MTYQLNSSEEFPGCQKNPMLIKRAIISFLDIDNANNKKYMIFLGEIFTVFSWRKNIEHKHEESIYFPNIQTDFSRDEIIPKDMVLILWNKVILQAPINLSANYENFSNHIFQK